MVIMLKIMVTMLIFRQKIRIQMVNSYLCRSNCNNAVYD